MIFEIIEDIFNAAKWPVAVLVFDKFVLQKILIPEYVSKHHVRQDSFVDSFIFRTHPSGSMKSVLFQMRRF